MAPAALPTAAAAAGGGKGGVLYTYVANEEGGGGVLNNVHFALHDHRRTQNDIHNPKYFKTCLNFLELDCFLVASTCQLSAKRFFKSIVIGMCPPMASFSVSLPVFV